MKLSTCNIIPVREMWIPSIELLGMNPLAMNFVSPKDLSNVNDKIIFDCYYCTNSSR